MVCVSRSRVRAGCAGRRDLVRNAGFSFVESDFFPPDERSASLERTWRELTSRMIISHHSRAGCAGRQVVSRHHLTSSSTHHLTVTHERDVRGGCIADEGREDGAVRADASRPAPHAGGTHAGALPAGQAVCKQHALPPGGGQPAPARHGVGTHRLSRPRR
eukprot:1179538-Prorocentrum_minimum.AAC.1